MAADWQKIRTEYITTNTTYRELAKKYDVDVAVIGRRAKKEEWVNARQQHVDKTQTRMLENISKQEASRAARIYSVADKLLNKIEAIVETVEPEGASAKDIRALTAAVKDLKEIQNMRSDSEREEQEERIKKLRREAEPEGSGERQKLIVEGLPEEFKA